MSYEYLVMTAEEANSLFPGLKDVPTPTLEELLAEGVLLDENGKDTTNPRYGAKHTSSTRKKMKANQWDRKSKNNPNYGKKATDYNKQRSSETNFQPDNTNYHTLYKREWRKRHDTN